MQQPHIQLDSSIGCKYAILPGDPARIDRIIPFLTNTHEETFCREYRSLTGFYKGLKILCMSTGMGGVSTAIGLEELRNIGIEAVIRIGSCGTLQPYIQVGDLIIVSGCVRDEGTSQSYIRATYPAVPDTDLLNCCIRYAKETKAPFHVGITRSHESFYAQAEINQEEYWHQQGVLANDMETASLLVVGRLGGMKCASLLNNVVAYNEDKAGSVGSYSQSGSRAISASDSDSPENPAMAGEKREILTALEALWMLDAM